MSDTEYSKTLSEMLQEKKKKTVVKDTTHYLNRVI